MASYLLLLLLAEVTVAEVIDFRIACSDAVVSMMNNCTMEEYKSSPRPEKCDYQLCNVSLFGGPFKEEKVRRKGTATFRHPGYNPSFKIKLGSKYQFSPSWESKKVTLNAGAQGLGEIKAYPIFQSKGLPASEIRSVTVQFNGYRSKAYTLVETVSDNGFMEKHFEFDNRADWILWDDTGECKREGDDAPCVCEIHGDGQRPPCGAVSGGLNNLTYADFNISNLVRFYQAEVETNHYDGACHAFRDRKNQTSNNYYLVRKITTHYLVPWGTDQTMQCDTRIDTHEFVCNPVQTYVDAGHTIDISPIKCGSTFEAPKQDVVVIVVILLIAIYCSTISIL